MAVLQKVILVGGTGETGKEILKALLADGSYQISCLIRPASTNKPTVLNLDPSVKRIVVDLSAPTSEIASALKGHDTLISAIGFLNKTTELSLVDAAAMAGISRFVPCSWASVIPPGGIVTLRDEKERVLQRVWQHRMPWTLIDVGYWQQLSIPRVPSGRLDYVIVLPANEIHAGGEAKNLLMNKCDIGAFVARIVKDPKTVNKKVICWAEELSQKDVVKMVEEKSGEKLEMTETSAETLTARRDAARAAYLADPSDAMKKTIQSASEYGVSKFIREDNTLENAKYLGYLDARELYPDLKPTTFAEFVGELLEGKGVRPYAGAFDFEKYHKSKSEQQL